MPWLLRGPEPEASISPATPGRDTRLPAAAVIDFAALPERTHTTMAGLLLTIPDLVALDLPAMVTAGSPPPQHHRKDQPPCLLTSPPPRRPSLLAPPSPGGADAGSTSNSPDPRAGIPGRKSALETPQGPPGERHLTSHSLTVLSLPQLASSRPPGLNATSCTFVCVTWLSAAVRRPVRALRR